MTEKDLISLKEAAKVSGYSPDYIGQLIRSGKIPGKQVYTNISWMTTAEAVLDYKNSNKKKQANPSTGDKLLSIKRQLAMEMEIIKLVIQNFKSAIPLLILMFLIFGAIVYSIFYFSNPTKAPVVNNLEENTNTIEF